MKNSAFENYMISLKQAHPSLSKNKIMQQYAQNDQERLQEQQKEKEQFEMKLQEKQTNILQKYGLPQKTIKEFKFKNLTLEEYFKNQKKQEIDSNMQENQKNSWEVVVRCSYDKNVLKALLKIHKYLKRFGVNDFQVYITRGQAQQLFLTLFKDKDQVSQVSLWNNSLDPIQNDYNCLVETIQNRIKFHFEFNHE